MGRLSGADAELENYFEEHNQAALNQFESDIQDLVEKGYTDDKLRSLADELSAQLCEDLAVEDLESAGVSILSGNLDVEVKAMLRNLGNNIVLSLMT